MANSSGKTTLSIFVGLIVILLVCSTSIGFFLYHKEAQKRQQADADLALSQASDMKAQADLKEARRQLALALDKSKEADEKINNLMDEVELNDGLRKELKNENASLKEAIEAAKKERDRVKGEVEEVQRRYKQVQELFKAEQDKNAELANNIKQLQEQHSAAIARMEAMKADLKPVNQRTPEQQVAGEVVPPADRGGNKVELDKIVVNPSGDIRGRVLSVDKDADFVVCNLGVKKGVKSGDVLSVFRGDEYLGDVRVSRVQEELSAADLIPPFNSHKVRKNDTVVFKS